MVNIMIRILSLLLLINTLAGAATHPNMFINANEIAAIQAKVAAGQEPWKTAYNDMIKRANSALSTPPQSVTFTGNTSNTYYTESPYNWSNNMPSPCGDTHCDGIINPKADRADYTTVDKMGTAVRALGLGYAFTGNTKYADKAVALAKVFFVDAATKMNPDRLGCWQGRIETSTSIPAAMYGLDLLWNYAGFQTIKADIKDWANRYAAYFSTFTDGKNIGEWNQALIAACGVIAENQTHLNKAFNTWKGYVGTHISSKGEMLGELSRTRSLDYSSYAVLAMTTTAEIARHQGVDLYNYTSGGKNMELVYDYHAPYMVNPASWPREQITTFTGTDAAWVELAYRFKQKSIYLQAINKYGRPWYDIRDMGPVTLTHAYGLNVKPVVAVPVVSPNGGSHVGSVEVTITCATSGATIRYTTDGSTPTTGSTRYTGPITLTGSATIKAKAFKSGIDPSGVATASFTVTEDKAAPRIVSVSTAGDPTKVVITFDELLDATTATSTSNYSIPGLTISSAALSSKTVTLAVSTMTEGTEYTLTVSGIKDKAATPNTMGSTSVTFTYNESFVDDFDSKRLTWTVTTGSRWSVETDGTDKSWHINTSSYSPVSTSIPGEIATVNGLVLGDFEMSVACKSPSSENSNANRDYGVVFGYQDANNFWYFLANGTAGNNQLLQVVNGSRTEKLNLNTALITDSDYHTLKIVVQNGKVAIYQDGVKKGEAAAAVADGKVGVCSYNDEVWFDDFVVVPLGGSQTVLQMPVIPKGLDLDIMEAGIYSIDGRRVQNDRASGVYLRVQIVKGVKVIQRFVTIGW